MNWTKLLFQILNLAIMVFILYRLFSKSALRALDEHSQKATRALDMAEQHEREANAAYAQFQARLAQMQDKSASLRQEAREELWRFQKHSLAETRDEIETLRANAARDVERTLETSVHEYRCELGWLVTRLSERLIQEAGGVAFQDACIARFVERLSLFSEGEYRDRFRVDADQQVPVRVVSASVLDTASVAQIAEQAQKIAGRPVHVIRKVDPALVAGVTMYIADRVIDGSVAGALSTLYERYVAELEVQAQHRRVGLAA
jgi:F0F1-type ATP synthase membrane subunit b/b'